MRLTRICTTKLRNAIFILPLTVAACGGGSDVGSTFAASKDEISPAVAKAELAAAASAAATEDVPAAISMKMRASAVEDDSMTDQFIVKYKDGSAERKNTADVERKLNRLGAAFPAKAHHKRRMGIGADVITSERSLNAREARAFMRAVASDPNVEYIEPDGIKTGQLVPNDSLYSTQWHLHSNQAPNPRSPGIRAEGAWDITTGADIPIAIVDSGVTNHSDLSSNVLPGYDFVSRNNGGNGIDPGRTTETCETQWHGTLVAGVAAELTNNSIGGAGVAPGAKIVPVRVLNACGRGFDSNILDGITWAAGGQIAGIPVNSNPAKVINVSLGGQRVGCSKAYEDAIDFATSQGATVVVAAGNSSIDVRQWEPANCRNVIAVGATHQTGANWYWSNFGQGIDIAAPGTGIWSTYNNGKTTPADEGYNQMDGTSAAAPQISGILALMNAVAPRKLTTPELRTLLQQNVQPFPEVVTEKFGPGIADATKAVTSAKSGYIPVAADFKCVQAADAMRITCKDLSTARGGASIKTWAWNFGTGSTGDMVRNESVTPYLAYEYSGSYSIRLSVTDANGRVSTVVRPMQVSNPPSIALDSNVPVTFSIPRSNGVIYRILVPENAKNITASVQFEKSTDVATVYLKNSPSYVNPDCTNGQKGGTFSCVVNNPPKGQYYILVLSGTADPLNNAKITWTYTL